MLCLVPSMCEPNSLVSIRTFMFILPLTGDPATVLVLTAPSRTRLALVEPWISNRHTVLSQPDWSRTLEHWGVWGGCEEELIGSYIIVISESTLLLLKP